MDAAFFNVELMNKLVLLGFAVLGWFLRELYAAVKELKEDLAKMRENVHENYVRKDYFMDFKRDIMSVLERIESKLDKKQDKD